MNRQCTVAGCPREAAPRRVLCHTHHMRQWRNGDVHQKYAAPDLLAVDTAVRDRRRLPGMTPKERAEAGVRLTQLGLSASEIARIFAVTPRTVFRWRTAASANLTNAA